MWIAVVCRRSTSRKLELSGAEVQGQQAPKGGAAEVVGEFLGDEAGQMDIVALDSQSQEPGSKRRQKSKFHGMKGQVEGKKAGMRAADMEMGPSLATGLLQRRIGNKRAGHKSAMRLAAEAACVWLGRGNTRTHDICIVVVGYYSAAWPTQQYLTTALTEWKHSVRSVSATDVYAH